MSRARTLDSGPREPVNLRCMPRARNTRPNPGEGARLKRLRSVLGLSQRELAAEFRVTHGAVAAWESGKQAPPGPVVKLLDLYEEEIGIGADDGGIVRLKTSMLSRGAALSRAAATAFTQSMAAWLERMLAADEHRNAISERAHAAIARNLVATLGDLKGLALKVGQTIGYLDYDLPEAARAAFSTLQIASRPMSPVNVAHVFLEEFGEPPRRLFAEWSPQPFAAASIGQVHRARLASGEEVAVKVQYPAIVDAIDSDLRSAAIFDRLGGLLFRGQEPGSFLAEMRERFLEECDYRIEAENQEEFRRRWAGRPGIRIPTVHHEFTRRRVLVTSLEAGENLDGYLRHASPEARARAGLALWQFCFESFYRHGCFHADPHAGNFLFANDALVVLDFGCVKRFPPAHVALWRETMRAAMARDGATIRDLMIGSRSVPDPARYDFEYDIRTLYTFYQPWLRDAPFQFTREFAEATWRMAVVDNPNKFRVNTPKDWFLANRTQFGLYSMLGRLEACANYHRPMLDLLYEPGEPRPASFAESELALLRRAPDRALTA
jgi:predicted unusual protein kinase regulating ubiquinone biosynthesis (AarF/ABC1/UbiB family)/DNA-binding transcriptional regulator YiaG